MNASRFIYLSSVCVLLLSAVAYADPRIQYSTYLGGSKTSCTAQGIDPCSTPRPPFATARFVAEDAAHNVYVGGLTNETDFPITPGLNGSLNIVCEGNGDNCQPSNYFIAKFSSSGGLSYSTFLPGQFTLTGIAADGAGNVYASTANSNCESCFREYDAVLLKFTTSGTVAYTFDVEAKLSPNCPAQQDTATAVAVNSAGTTAYLAVQGTGGTGPECPSPTPGAYDFAGTTSVLKFNVSNASSASLTYLAYVGSPAKVSGIAVDNSGNAYIAGASNGSDIPISSNAFQRTFQGGDSDGFVMKLNSAGSVLVYSTFLGSSGTDRANAIVVDRFGDATVAGVTQSTNFPHTRSYGTDVSSIAFVTRLAPDGSSLAYSDIILGPAANGIATDSAGNGYIVGGTGSSAVPQVIPLQSGRKGATDAWFANTSSSGVLTTSSYLGGSGGESGNAIVVDSLWNAYVVGSTSSTDFPVTANAYKRTLTGSQAAFLSKIIIDADLSLTASPSPTSVAHGANLTYTYAVTNKGPDSSDGDTLSTSIPTGTTFVSSTTTTGTCSHLAVGGTGAFTCNRGSVLLAGHSWGPITLTVKVNTASGGTVSNFAKMTTKTQDVNTSNNSASTTVKVQ